MLWWSGSAKIQLGMPENLVCFCENSVCANPTTNGTPSNATGNVCWVKTFRGGNLFGEMSGSNVWGNCPGWEIPREKTSMEKCWDPHAGLQVYTCSGYDLWLPGYIDYRQTDSNTDSRTDRQSDRQLWPVILLAQPAELIKTVNMLCWWLHLLYACLMLYKSVSKILTLFISFCNLT